MAAVSCSVTSDGVLKTWQGSAITQRALAGGVSCCWATPASSPFLLQIAGAKQHAARGSWLTAQQSRDAVGLGTGGDQRGKQLVACGQEQMEERAGHLVLRLWLAQLWVVSQWVPNTAFLRSISLSITRVDRIWLKGPHARAFTSRARWRSPFLISSIASRLHGKPLYPGFQHADSLAGLSADCCAPSFADC